MNKKLNEALKTISDFDLVETKVEFGFYSVTLTYMFSDSIQSEMSLIMGEIVYLKYLGGLRTNESSLFIGETKLVKDKGFLSKLEKEEIEKISSKIDGELYYLSLEGEIKLDVVCGSIILDPHKGTEPRSIV